jgi:hypothetical protein
MSLPDQAVVQVDLAAQLRPHRAVLVRFLRIEGAVGEDKVAFLPERHEPRDQFLIVQLVERRVNLATILFDVVEQIEQLRAKQTAKRIAQRVAGFGDEAVQLGAFTDRRERARNPLRRNDAFVEIGADMRRRLPANGHRRRLRARVSERERQAALVRSDNWDDRILNHIAGVDQIVPPHVPLKRELPRRGWIELVGVGKSDKAVQITVPRRPSAIRFQCSVNCEAAAVRNRLLIGGQPDKTCVVSVVVDLEFNRHRGPPAKQNRTSRPADRSPALA